MKYRNIWFQKINYLQLSKLGSKLNLSFSNHEILDNKIIALDGIKKILIVMERNYERSRPHIIELAEVRSITVKQIYNSIKAGELKTKKIEEFLESVLLQFEFGNEKDPIVLPFFEGKINEIHDLPRLEKRARSWQLMLSKLLPMQNTALVEDKRQLHVAY